MLRTPEHWSFPLTDDYQHVILKYNLEPISAMPKFPKFKVNRKRMNNLRKKTSLTLETIRKLCLNFYQL